MICKVGGSGKTESQLLPIPGWLPLGLLDTIHGVPVCGQTVNTSS